MGILSIGTETTPYTNDLTITMHGNYWGRQLPEFGNKVLGCHSCKLDIHGSPKTPTWSRITATINTGATSLTIEEPSNWIVGD